MKNDNRENRANERVIYVPSYTLSKKDPSRLSVMSLETAKTGIEMMKKGLGTKIVFSTAYEWWVREADLKKELASKEGIMSDQGLIVILSGVTNSYDEAEMLSVALNNLNATIILVAQKWHARRAAKILKKHFSKVEIVKVPTAMERQLDPSWLKSFLCSSTKLNWILWNWFFGIITPWMMRRQMRKEGK